MRAPYPHEKFTKPIPHVVIDNFLDSDTVRAINAEWPTADEDKWYKEEGRTTLKWSTNDLPHSARIVVAGFDTKIIEEAIGVPNILPDPDGGALHSIPPDGFLNMHYDFNIHQRTRWRRRANALIYLNERWEDEWNGHLQLGLKEHTEPKYIAPIGGRCVIFETNEASWHGHPKPLRCPPDVQRRSLAIYFYTDDADPDTKRRTTVYFTKKREEA